MPAFSGQTDIMMSLTGDLVLDGTGDFRLTDGFDWLVREINKRIRTINPEWVGHENIGADVEAFAGRPNTKELATEIKNRIIESISQSRLEYPGTLDARVVPTAPDSVNIFIYFDLAGVKYNLTRLIFDFDTGLVRAVDDPQTNQVSKVSNRPFVPEGQTTPTNKYLNRIYGNDDI